MWLSRERERERERGSALRKVPIVNSVYHLYESFHECLIAFPKSERYSLGATCQSEILELLRVSLRAASSTKPSDKAAYINEASVRLDSLRLLLNLCKDCKCVSNQTYQQLDSTCNEIGRMLGGWLKSITSSP
ncbi:MAG: four helix bundle protein [Candidatus Microsaccharimonas sossegonensis]|uniref:Four helix bundle protein n=1 Tax=Candidatus Microsaccharimonas sossegonensis TaxID=2506948 RepID=A0A4Q0AHT9_9BACT|nr:MAG: four helix bundle protein [Candidatus Microsaccharimonas sossegonensis]